MPGFANVFSEGMTDSCPMHALDTIIDAIRGILKHLEVLRAQEVLFIALSHA
jgi:hypothetical protein